MKVFLSSTCYDLKDTRAFLEEALHDLGHQPILSDRTSFPVEANAHRHERCVEEAGESDFFILVVDERFGAPYFEDKSISVTWAEYRAARESKTPILVFVRKSVWDERNTIRKNPDVEIKPAHCNDVRIFDFLSEVQQDERGTWIYSFIHGTEIVEVINNTKELMPRPKGPLRYLPQVETQQFIEDTLGEIEAVVITLDGVERCLQAFDAIGDVGVVMDHQIGPEPGDVFHLYETRVADDDGFTVYAARGVTPRGHRIFADLKRGKTILEQAE